MGPHSDSSRPHLRPRRAGEGSLCFVIVRELNCQVNYVVGLGTGMVLAIQRFSASSISTVATRWVKTTGAPNRGLKSTATLEMALRDDKRHPLSVVREQRVVGVIVDRFGDPAVPGASPRPIRLERRCLRWNREHVGPRNWPEFCNALRCVALKLRRCRSMELVAG